MVEGLDDVDDEDDGLESEDVDFESVLAGLFSVLLSFLAPPSAPALSFRA